jgi:hypothetical protein
MPSLDLAQQIGAVEIVISAALITLGIVIFTALAKWWRSEGGWHVFCFMASIGAVLDLSAARVILGASLDVPWFIWVRVVVFSTVPIVIAWRVWIIIMAQVIRPVRERSTLRAERGAIHEVPEQLDALPGHMDDLHHRRAGRG